MRNFEVLVSRSRMIDSLCCTSGWSTTVTASGFGGISVSYSEQRAVAGDGKRRAIVGPQFGCDFAAGGPAAAFQYSRERQFGGALAEPVAHRRGEPVEQRHGQGTPFDHGLAKRIERAGRQRRIARLDHAAIEE